jgi:hypothetical protein
MTQAPKLDLEPLLDALAEKSTPDESNADDFSR